MDIIYQICQFFVDISKTMLLIYMLCKSFERYLTELVLVFVAMTLLEQGTRNLKQKL